MPEAVTRLHAQILAADAILIGCPEYNYSKYFTAFNIIQQYDISRLKSMNFIFITQMLPATGHKLSSRLLVEQRNSNLDCHVAC